MTSQTYTTAALVLRKTKLSETDLIVTLLGEDGSQLRAVAKGARKPSSVFATRLELYNEVKLLLAQGKNLDIVKEVSVLSRRSMPYASPEHMMLFAVASEVATKLTQQSLPYDNVYNLTRSAFARMDEADVSQALVVLAAYLLKLCAFVGIKPETRCCVYCGSDIMNAYTASSQNQRLPNVRFSFAEGGGICPDCAQACGIQGTTALDGALFAWVDVFLYSSFADLIKRNVVNCVCIELLRFVERWLREHFQIQIKSMSCVYEFLKNRP